MAARRTRDWEFDPGIEAIAAPYTMAALAYYGEQLGLQTEARYEVLSDDVHRKWNWSRGDEQGNSFASTSPDLSRAMRRNPHLKVFVASGRYDLGTPYSASDWSLAQPGHRCAGAPAAAAPLLRCRAHDVHARGRLLKLKSDLGAWLAE
jgi:carboxypeptidase C (cathepsin A)